MPLFVKGAASILYVHVPKTGGTSIERMFRDHGFRTEYLDDLFDGFNLFRKCSPQHLHGAPLRDLLRPAKLRYIFMTVRHPMARLLSEYRMQERTANRPMRLPQWFDWMMTLYIDDPYVADNHLRPQHDFLIPGCDVFRHEDGFGPAFLARLAERTGTDFALDALGTHKPADRREIDPAEVELIRPRVIQFYRQDYTVFGYAAE